MAVGRRGEKLARGGIARARGVDWLWLLRAPGDAPDPSSVGVDGSAIDRRKVANGSRLEDMAIGARDCCPTSRFDEMKDLFWSARDDDAQETTFARPCRRAA